MDLGQIASGQPRTDLLYLREMNQRQSRGRVLKVVREKASNAYLVLDQTIFHPKGGGQPSDRGMIRSSAFEASVKKAIYQKGIVIHWAKIIRGLPAEGDIVCELDWQFRHLVMRRHTAAHLLDHCLAQAMGRRVQTTDSWLDEPCYVGYTGDLPLEEDLRETEALANTMIKAGGAVKIQFLRSKEAKVLLQQAPNYERLPDLPEIRTVAIEGCQPIPCGGTHVVNITEIAAVSISRAEQLPDGAFRLHFSVPATVPSVSPLPRSASSRDRIVSG